MPKAPHLSDAGHEAQAFQRALADCGLPKSAIDGYFSAGMPGVNDTIEMAEYLGIDHKAIGGTGIGGAVFEFLTEHAVAAIREGQCDTALISYGSALLTKVGPDAWHGQHAKGGRAGFRSRAVSRGLWTWDYRQLRHGREATYV